MKKLETRTQGNQSTTAIEKTEPEHENPFKDDVDICQQLMSRYSGSSAPQHRHLLATTAALRSILESESLPLTPPSYLAAAIENLSRPETLDSTAVAALLSLVSVLGPLVKGIKEEKAREAVQALAGIVEWGKGGMEVGVGSLRGLVKCLGILIVGFCDLEDWDSVKDGFGTLVKLSIDKRPKVRKSALESLEKVFKSLGSKSVRKEASKLVFSLLKHSMPEAIRVNELRVEDWLKEEALSKPDHLEVLHVLNMVNIVILYLSVKIRSKIFSELVELSCAKFSVLTRHLFKIIESCFGASDDYIVGQEMENIVDCLCSYVSNAEKNPADTLISAVVLLRLVLGMLQAQGSSTLMKNLLKVCESVAGLLTGNGNTASVTSDIMKELIKNFVDVKMPLIDENQSSEDASQRGEEAEVITSICAKFESILSSSNEIPKEHVLGVISLLFQKLRVSSYIYMKHITLKLADLRSSACSDVTGISHLDHCIGSAVVAMGPERIIELLPISFDTTDHSCTNAWLIPILKSHIVGASLGYYVEHIVPLAKSFQRASNKVKDNSISQDLESHAHDLLELLCAFCRYPVDTHKKFQSLATLLITFLQKDSFMHQNVATALKVLVDQNKSILYSQRNAVESNCPPVDNLVLELASVAPYSKKVATRNIRALAASSREFLQDLVDIYVVSIPNKRICMKDAIAALASITDPSVTKNIFVSLCKRFHLGNVVCESAKLKKSDDDDDDSQNDKEQGCQTAKDKDDCRLVIVELASSLVKGATEDLINLIYRVVVTILQANDVGDYCQAYHTLSRILEEQAWFCSSRLVELINLLLGLKPPTEVASLRSRFACFRVLMIHMLEMSLEEENAKAFLVLNEIILTLKSGSDEARKVSYDTLLTISSHLRDKSCISSYEPYHKMINMILGYLSGSSPHIKSGAVSVLSLLVYNDANICIDIPDLVPSILSLLQMKAVEIVKAALGFVKVLVSSLQGEALQRLLSDIIDGVLSWSSVSRNHFRSKVTVILEIMIRKCSAAAVESVTPDQHKHFLKTVFQNRHHRATANDTGSISTTASVAENFAAKRLDKRKHGESHSVTEANGALHHKKKTKREIQPKSVHNNAGSKEGKRAKLARGNKPMKHRSEDGGTRKNLSKEHRSWRKRKSELRNTCKKVEVHNGSNLKICKRGKAWKKKSVTRQPF